ncbi:MAG: ImmA/IrrE family metallo-endopeptidase [Armatimonadetes bacterium]|nr:ImmA/IrrE family metallo-endopeptidase [Armatimonadota bacterium]
MISVIKTESDYEAALSAIDELLDADPDPGTPDADRLEVLSVLVQEYERKKHGRSLPDPVDAIQFRMEQQGLTQRDLVPYIGSRSKVSEVLSRKRPLTLSMIRALHAHLGIPAEVLLQDQGEGDLPSDSIEWDRFPVREIVRRNWVRTACAHLQDHAEDVVRALFDQLSPELDLAVLYRTGRHVRSARSMDQYALAAWTARIMVLAQQDPPGTEYAPGTVTPQFMRELAQLSPRERGPLLARDFLKHHGISLVTELHLPRTYLDGAAVLLGGGMPIVGLTLRHDRLDNFWFSLMHELAHIALHFGNVGQGFYDDLDLKDARDPCEIEADRFAGEALIPKPEWDNSPAKILPSPEAAEHLAGRLGIHTAIVAGRIRRERNSYKILTQLVGHGKVRELFE